VQIDAGQAAIVAAPMTFDTAKFLPLPVGLSGCHPENRAVAALKPRHSPDSLVPEFRDGRVAALSRKEIP